MIRAFLIYVVVALVILIVGVQVSHRFMTPLEGLGKTFFYAIETSEYNAAYQMCSQALQKQYSEYQLIQFLKANDLIDPDNSDWHTVQQKGNQARILGNVTLKSGQSVPLEIYAVMEGETKYPYIGDISFIPFIGEIKIWKINSFVLPGKRGEPAQN